MTDPLTRMLEEQGCVVLDGGLATALEANGFVLDDHLWSARILRDDPAAIRQVHLDYLIAGADCITTASYQASIPGFAKAGATADEAVAWLALSVELALEAREVFWRDPGNRRGRVRPLVAASIGPYGAFLADGSEYTGRYRVDDDGLRRYHGGRLEILTGVSADLLACETLPSRREAEVLLELIAERPAPPAWLSFCCRDGTRLWDGTELATVARLCDAVPGVVAVGINCTAPQYLASLIAEVRAGTNKPILVYPNSGERYDSERKVWRGAPTTVDWARLPAQWVRLGAVGVGGCCRVGPGEIALMRRGLLTVA